MIDFFGVSLIALQRRLKNIFKKRGSDLEAIGMSTSPWINVNSGGPVLYEHATKAKDGENANDAIWPPAPQSSVRYRLRHGSRPLCPV